MCSSRNTPGIVTDFGSQSEDLAPSSSCCSVDEATFRSEFETMPFTRVPIISPLLFSNTHAESSKLSKSATQQGFRSSSGVGLCLLKRLDRLTRHICRLAQLRFPRPHNHCRRRSPLLTF